MSNVKHQPATPLPWTPVSGRTNEAPGAPVETELRGGNRQVAVRLGRLISDTQKQDAAYIEHAANAYPKLVGAVRNLLEVANPDSRSADLARALLRDFGEGA